MSHLTVVRDDDADDDGSDFGGVDDTALRFTGAIDKLAFHRSGALQVTLTIDERSGISHLDLRVLQRRLLDVSITPRDQKGNPTDPRKDPVKAKLFNDRMERMMDGWVGGDDDSGQDDGYGPDLP